MPSNAAGRAGGAYVWQHAAGKLTGVYEAWITWKVSTVSTARLHACACMLCVFGLCSLLTGLNIDRPLVLTDYMHVRLSVVVNQDAACNDAIDKYVNCRQGLTQTL